MTDSAGLAESLTTMGFVELALAFTAMGCYCLVLGASGGRRARQVAAASAALAAGGLIALTDPWMNGMILVAAGIGCIGVFVGFAWALSAACGLVQSPSRPVSAAEPMNAAPSPSSAAMPLRPSSPAHS